MKVVNLEKGAPTVKQLISLARKQNVLLRTADGQEFVLAEIDDFAQEVSSVRRNKGLMRLLARRSKEKETYDLAEVKQRLGLR